MSDNIGLLDAFNDVLFIIHPLRRKVRLRESPLEISHGQQLLLLIVTLPQDKCHSFLATKLMVVLRLKT